jgi:hypothetical protein
MEAPIEVQTLKSDTCPSLSGKTKLSYDVGRGAGGEILVRISKTNGTGYYSKDWIPLDRAYRMLQANGKKPVTFGTLLPLFPGQSINTAGFLLAVLKYEGLVRASPEKARCYELGDGKRFFEGIKTLLSSGVAATKPISKKSAAAAKRPTDKNRPSAK